jgi:hypothetical protein
MKKRPRRNSEDKPPPAPAERSRQYKVVELSTVDESSLEEAVNRCTKAGWDLDSLHFAMRESSKRPAMAFVFFSRMGADDDALSQDRQQRARRRLLALAGEGEA